VLWGSVCMKRETLLDGVEGCGVGDRRAGDGEGAVTRCALSGMHAYALLQKTYNIVIFESNPDVGAGSEPHATSWRASPNKP
jgi:hypothetical protein